LPSLPGALRQLSELSRFFASHPIGRRAPHRAWARFVRWQISSRLKSEIAFPWVGGQRLLVRRGMFGATGNIYVGLHEFRDMIFLLHLLRADDLFLDIGANVGTYTILASGICKARTWAFEPDPRTVADLNANIALNALGERVRVFEVALGPSDGEVAFTVGLDTVNHVAAASDLHVRTVKQQRLDALMGGELPVLAKLDVEGYEDDVLAGAAGVLANGGLKALEIETITPATVDLLTRNGFARAYYDPAERRLHRDRPDLASSNALFVRDWDFVAARVAAAPPVSVLGQLI
jgi:FkbM family methyltransferase